MTLNEWNSFSITQEFVAELKRRQVEVRDKLAMSAGIDPRLDSYRSGVYAALEDVINFRFEENEETQ